MSFTLHCPKCGHNIGSGHTSHAPDASGDAHVSLSITAKVPKDHVEHLTPPKQEHHTTPEHKAHKP
jgi:hypothetical protein